MPRLGLNLIQVLRPGSGGSRPGLNRFPTPAALRIRSMTKQFYYVPASVFHKDRAHKYYTIPIIFTICPGRYPTRHGYQEVAFFQRFLLELLPFQAIVFLPPFTYNVGTTQRHIIEAAHELGYQIKSYPNKHSIVIVRVR
jgi:hypothetical protein